MRLHRTSLLRGCAALLVAGGTLAAVAGPSRAEGLTDPLAPVTQPLTSALSTLPVPLPTVPLPTAPALPLTTGSGGSTGPSTSSTSTPPSRAAARSASTGTTAPSAGGGSSARGGTARPASVVAVDASVQGLLGACVRVTREVAPLQTTLVVLDRDLIRELTAAGLPLQQLVVPCPGDSTSSHEASSSTAPTRGSSLSEADQVSALSSVGRLAFTGSDVVPTVLAGLGMLALGVLLVRARALVPVRRRS